MPKYYDEDASMSDDNEEMLDDNLQGVENYQGQDMIRVSARSRSTAVAGAIAGVIREHGRAEVQAIGAGAVNQAVKALAIARSYLQRDQIDIIFWPYFTEVDIEGQERTAVRFTVQPSGSSTNTPLQ